MKKLRPETYEEFLEKFEMNVPERYNFVYDMLDPKAAAHPDEIAMIHVDDDGVRREYSYGWFAEISSRLAGGLQDAGLGKGDRVMIILHRRVEFWVSMLALSRIGAVGIPSPSLLTAKDIEYRINFASVRGVVTDHHLIPRVDEALSACPGLRFRIQASGGENAEGWLDFDALCDAGPTQFPRPEDAAGGEDTLLIFFSSGTMGQPKMVAHPHTYPLGHYVTGVYWHDLEPGDIHLTVSDTGWGKALWGKFYGQWMAGAVVFVYDFRGKFEPADLLRVVADHKITSFCAPPTVYRFLVREDLRSWDFSALRHCTTAGELLNESVFHTWKEILGLPIYEGYGQTETTLQLATFPCMAPRPGSIGKPSPGWDVVLLNDDDQECAPGEEGEICIRMGGSPVWGLFSAYLKEPEKTAESMRDGFYRTGDKAWMDEDGYFWFMGRVDDLIKSSGYRIGPFEVESALVAHDAVVEAAVTGIPDPVRGQVVKATVILSAGYEGNEELVKTLQDHVRKVTAPYKYPRVIEFVTELPKTISGKIKRADIRNADLEKMTADGG
ncbi:MAG: acyl-CoA synthetase [Desulfobacterales bacterium]|nr:MAG: acyl-CoA synthetase [Desulfobacterales bacterium]